MKKPPACCKRLFRRIYDYAFRAYTASPEADQCLWCRCSSGRILFAACFVLLSRLIDKNSRLHQQTAVLSVVCLRFPYCSLLACICMSLLRFRNDANLYDVIMKLFIGKHNPIIIQTVMEDKKQNLLLLHEKCFSLKYLNKLYQLSQLQNLQIQFRNPQTLYTNLFHLHGILK